MAAQVALLALALALGARHAAAASSPFVTVGTSAGLLQALQDQSVNQVLVTNDFALDPLQWNAARVVHITRSVRITGAVSQRTLDVNGEGTVVPVYVSVTFSNLVQVVHLEPGVSLTFDSMLLTQQVSNLNGFNQQYITASPNASVNLFNVVLQRAACLPLQTTVNNILSWPVQPSGALESQRASVVNATWCYATTATRTACVGQYVRMADVQGSVMLSSELLSTGGQGGYNLRYANVTYICSNQVTAACLAANSPSVCLSQLEESLARALPSPPPLDPGGGGGGGGGLAPWAIGVIVACCVGTAILVAVICFLAFRWWHSKRMFSHAGGRYVPKGPQQPPEVEAGTMGEPSQGQPAAQGGAAPGGNSSDGAAVLQAPALIKVQSLDSLCGKSASQMPGLLAPAARQASTDSPYETPDPPKAETLRQQVDALVKELRGAGQELEVLNAIGRGGNGVVYRGRWRHQEVAIKTIVIQDDGGEVQKRAMVETAVSTTMLHPNVVATYHYDIVPLERPAGQSGQVSFVADSGTTISDHSPDACCKLYIVQEFCSLGDLDRALATRMLCDPNSSRPNAMLLASILNDIAAAMKYIHSKHIIHGDLKPSNVLLKPDSRSPVLMVAKVCDFGLSTRIGEDKTHVSNYRGGTPFYVAPEVVDHSKVTRASDMFSFGVMLWELCSGHRVFVRGRNGALTRNPKYAIFPKGTDEALLHLFNGCMEIEPKMRPTFDEVSAILAALQAKAQMAAGLSGMVLNMPPTRFAMGTPPGGLGGSLPMGPSVYQGFLPQQTPQHLPQQQQQHQHQQQQQQQRNQPPTMPPPLPIVHNGTTMAALL